MIRKEIWEFALAGVVLAVALAVLLLILSVWASAEILYEDAAACGTPGSTCRLSCEDELLGSPGNYITAKGTSTSCPASNYYSCGAKTRPGFNWETDWELETWTVVPECGDPLPYTAPPQPIKRPDPPPPNTINEPPVFEVRPAPRTYTDEVHFLSEGWHKCYPVDSLKLGNGFLAGPVDVYLRARYGHNEDNWKLYVWKQWDPDWNDEAHFRKLLDETERADKIIEDAEGQQLTAGPAVATGVRAGVEVGDLRGKMVCVVAHLPSVGGIADTIQGTTSQKGYSIGFTYTEH